MRNILLSVLISVLLCAEAQGGGVVLPLEKRCKCCQGTGWDINWLRQNQNWLRNNHNQAAIVWTCYVCEASGNYKTTLGWLEESRQMWQENRTNYEDDLNPTGWLVPSMKPTKPRMKPKPL